MEERDGVRREELELRERDELLWRRFERPEDGELRPRLYWGGGVVGWVGRSGLTLQTLHGQRWPPSVPQLICESFSALSPQR